MSGVLHGLLAEPRECVVKPERQRDISGRAHRASHSSNGLGERHFVRSGDGDGLPRQTASNDRCMHDADEVGHRERANEFRCEPDKGKNRKRVERVAQVIEHVVATAVDDAGLEDDVVEA